MLEAQDILNRAGQSCYLPMNSQVAVPILHSRNKIKARISCCKAQSSQ